MTVTATATERDRGFVIRVTDAQPGPALPAGTYHLLCASDDLQCRYLPGPRFMAICGGTLVDLPEGPYPPGGEADTDPRYCPECGAPTAHQAGRCCS